MPSIRWLLALLSCCVLSCAADWPQWLGPRRDGSCADHVTPWKGTPQIVWRQPVGEGHSSPILAGGRVFLHVKQKDKDSEALLAFDAASGKPIWNSSYGRGPFSSPFGAGPRGTPAVDGKRVYSLGVTGILTCSDTATGEQLWQKDTLKQFQAPNLTFGVSCSPLVHADLVYVNVGAKGASIVAFDKGNGDVRWKSLDDPASYSSPLLLGPAADEQLVFLTQQGLAALDPSKGSLHWRYPFVDLLSESSTTPVRVGDLLVASSVTVGSAALRLEQKDGKRSVTEVWKNPALTCYFSTPVPVGSDLLFMINGSIIPPPRATLRCVDPKTGKELWQKSGIGKYHAALLRTGNDKLLLLDDAGNLLLLEPNPQAYRELARAKVCGPTWAHPAAADGLLYIRDDKELICVRLHD